ncbi:MAG: DHH family phosphoesterase [Candidatus Thermoplasmatota archaeon]|nr:DHH family phosphoesterase [Candidatus Thermoplasmatota archaeon]
MLIVHHWDTDGICSAAKIVKALGVDPGNYVNISPPIGEFGFDSRIVDAMKEHDEIFVVDLNLPRELEGVRKKVTFIDHHIQERVKNDLVDHINPLLNGSDPADHPSCTVVISEHFDSWDLLSALGAVGDVGDRALKDPRVKDQLDQAGITIEEAKKIVILIDTSYVAVDLEAVEEAVNVVLSATPQELLAMPLWTQRHGDIRRSMKDAISNMEVIEGFAFIEYSSPYNIISKIARKAVWDMSHTGALVVNRDFHGKGQTYFRVDPETADRVDISLIIAKLKGIGINAGGKKEVVGSIYPVERTEEVLSVIRPFMKLER